MNALTTKRGSLTIKVSRKLEKKMGNVCKQRNIPSRIPSHTIPSLCQNSKRSAGNRIRIVGKEQNMLFLMQQNCVPFQGLNIISKGQIFILNPVLSKRAGSEKDPDSQLLPELWDLASYLHPTKESVFNRSLLQARGVDWMDLAWHLWWTHGNWDWRPPCPFMNFPPWHQIEWGNSALICRKNKESL